MQERWMIALQIIKKLLAKEEISLNHNIKLYQDYLQMDIEEVTQQMAQELDLEIYKYNECLYICPKVDAEIFGYSNQDLIKSIAYVKTNSELYLCYFIMYTIMTAFYKESSSYTFIGYVKLSQIYEKVNVRLNGLLDNTIDFGGAEHAEYSFKTLAEVWITLPDTREEVEDVSAEKTGKTKLGLIRSVCNFMVNEGLLKENIEEHHYRKTPRLAALISQYYSSKDNKETILDQLEKGL